MHSFTHLPIFPFTHKQITASHTPICDTAIHLPFTIHHSIITTLAIYPFTSLPIHSFTHFAIYYQPFYPFTHTPFTHPPFTVTHSSFSQFFIHPFTQSLQNNNQSYAFLPPKEPHNRNQFMAPHTHEKKVERGNDNVIVVVTFIVCRQFHRLSSIPSLSMSVSTLLLAKSPLSSRV